MRTTYPNTGHDATYEITNYSYDDNVYELKLTAYWYGKCTMLAEDECQTGYDLTLNIPETGKVYGYTINGSNDCAKQYALCDISMDVLRGAIQDGSNVNQ